MQAITPSQKVEPADPTIALSGGRRFFDAANKSWIVKVFPGEYYTTGRMDESIVTVLGSCVAACIRDPIAKMGGMNHFMLPQSQSGNWGGHSRSTRFGNFAMEKLINELIKAGCSRDRMEIKVFGGGNVTDTSNEIGTENCEFVLQYLQAEGLKCVAKDLGGDYPRRIEYFPATGRVVRRLLGLNEKAAVSQEETAFASRLGTRPPSGDIELFS